MSRNEKLKAARIARGWTIVRICQYLEIGESTYKDWEAGRHMPSIRHLGQICHLLKKTPQELGFKNEASIPRVNGSL